jgi:hypothetical protein
METEYDGFLHVVLKRVIIPIEIKTYISDGVYLAGGGRLHGVSASQGLG